MIAAGDRLALPEGVALRDGELHDIVRLAAVPVNATGRVVLAAPTPRDAAVALRRAHGVAAEAALDDVLAFCAELNGRFLLNVAPRRGPAVVVLRWLRAVPILLPLGVAPTLPTTRRPVDTTSLRTVVRTAPRALGAVAASLFLAGCAATALLLTLTGQSAPLLAVVVGAALAAGVALHELAHLVALHGVPACVVARGLRVAVVHRAVPRGRTQAVAAAGPVTGLGLCALLLVLLREAPSAELGAAAVGALLNAFGLTVLSRDGRTLCGLR